MRTCELAKMVFWQLNSHVSKSQPTLGSSNAPITVVELGDFKCPACKAWGENIFPQLIEDYVDTGKVKFSLVNVLFHGDESKLGSVAAEAIYKETSTRSLLGLS